MGSNILLEGQAPYEIGVLKLHLERQIVINISAQEAQKKINQFVHWEISSQMHAEPPTLVVGDDIFWQVPIHLTFPAFGDVGCVGAIKVDPISGQIDNSLAAIQMIIEKAEKVALRFTSSAAYTV